MHLFLIFKWNTPLAHMNLLSKHSLSAKFLSADHLCTFDCYCEVVKLLLTNSLGQGKQVVSLFLFFLKKGVFLKKKLRAAEIVAH